MMDIVVICTSQLHVKVSSSLLYHVISIAVVQVLSLSELSSVCSTLTNIQLLSVVKSRRIHQKLQLNIDKDDWYQLCTKPVYTISEELQYGCYKQIFELLHTVLNIYYSILFNTICVVRQFGVTIIQLLCLYIADHEL